MIVEGRCVEALEWTEAVERMKDDDSDVDAEVEESSVDANSPVSDGSCQTTVTKASPLPGRTRGPARRSTKGGWTAEEDEILTRVVTEFGGKGWKKIAEFFQGRTDIQCFHRWQKVLNPELVKGTWTKEEDEQIIELVNKYGTKKWSAIAREMSGRIGKQCRERWHNHLNPAIKKGAWTTEEEVTLIRAHQMHGNKWAEISKLLPGRSDNSIKNHWNCYVKKKLDSYSGLLGQQPGIVALSLNDNEIEAEKPKGFETSNASMVLDQKLSSTVVFKTPSADGNPRMSKEDSNCCETVEKPVTLDDSRCSDVEAHGSAKPLAAGSCDATPNSNMLLDQNLSSAVAVKTPSAVGNPRMSKEDSNCCETVERHVILEDSRCSDVEAHGSVKPLAAGSYDATPNAFIVFDQKPSPEVVDVGSRMLKEDSNCYETVGRPVMMEISRCSEVVEHGSEKPLSAVMIMETDQVIDCKRTPRKPVLVDTGSLSHICYEPLQISDLYECLEKVGQFSSCAHWKHVKYKFTAVSQTLHITGAISCKQQTLPPMAEAETLGIPLSHSTLVSQVLGMRSGYVEDDGRCSTPADVLSLIS